MKIEDFRLGLEFTSAGGSRRWRVTDIGTRVVVAIRIDRVISVRSRLVDGQLRLIGRQVIPRPVAEARGDFRGPPYGVGEYIFNEYGMRGCEPV